MAIKIELGTDVDLDVLRQICEAWCIDFEAINRGEPARTALRSDFEPSRFLSAEEQMYAARLQIAALMLLNLQIHKIRTEYFHRVIAAHAVLTGQIPEDLEMTLISKINEWPPKALLDELHKAIERSKPSEPDDESHT